jgi:thiol-disulfide isomerase/thioredoxin
MKQQIKMMKASPQQEKARKEQQAKLLRALNLTPTQQKQWGTIEAKTKAQRPLLIEKLKKIVAEQGDPQSLVGQLQGLESSERTAKEALLTPAQKKIFQERPEPSKVSMSSTSMSPADQALPNGTVAPPLTLQDRNGKKITLNNYRGKIVVLDFWGTWCAPCIESMPKVNALAAKSPDVAVLAINFNDSPQTLRTWLGKNTGFRAVQFVTDPSNNAVIAYKVKAFPTQVVIGRDGKIAATLTGYTGNEAALEGVIKAARGR